MYPMTDEAVGRYDKHVCNNCGEHGHLFHQCKLPIVSYGIIAFCGDQVLMIRRKDSFGYIEIIRGKYDIHNPEYMQTLVNEMSVQEKQRLLTCPFSVQWRQLWNMTAEQGKSSKLADEYNSLNKFNTIFEGHLPQTTTPLNVRQVQVPPAVPVSWKTMISNSTTQWDETEWEFPKGRRVRYESEIRCAVREFAEETGYATTDINVISNLRPLHELVIGSNGRTYKNTFYLAVMTKTTHTDITPVPQASEVSDMKWMTEEQSLAAIRDYYTDKKQVLSKAFHIYRNYILV